MRWGLTRAVLRVPASDHHDGEFSDPQVAWLMKTKPSKQVVSLLPNDETGQQMGAGNTASYAKAGAKLQVEYYERERVDFVPVLTSRSDGTADAARDRRQFSDHRGAHSEAGA